MGELLLGTSGWSYADWVGPFYATAEESKLRAYARVFATAEIDSTFYQMPTRGMVFGWLRYTPHAFVFAAKLPKKVTHKGKLEAKVVEHDLRAFCELMRPLQLEGKLACLLAQLPPGLKYDAGVLEGFLALVPAEFRLAVEFRHASWLRAEVWRLLERYRAAYTIVDEPLLPPLVKVTSDLAYVRWHGRGEHPWYYYLYEPEELQPWVARVEEARTQAETTLGYFNNHYHGYAVKNCLQFAEMLGAATAVQREAKQGVDGYFAEAEAARKKQMQERGATMAMFMPAEIDRMSFEELLNLFLDPGRLRRAKGIRDADVTVTKATDRVVEASIRDYRFTVDVDQRVVRHDCPDWSRCAPTKQFCKHVGKVMLTLPRARAVALLSRIASERHAWEFKPYEE